MHVDAAVLDDHCDAYHGAALKVFYSDAGFVEYIELSRDREISARYGGIDLFSTPAEAVVRHVSKDAPFDPNDPEFGYVYAFPRLELVFWRPVIPENSRDRGGFYFSTVGVGTLGYVSAQPNSP